MFFFSLLFLVQVTSAQVEDIGWRTRVEGFFGGHWNCAAANSQEMNRVDCFLSPHFKLTLGARDQGSIEDLTEELFFQELTKTSHDQGLCLERFLNTYSGPLVHGLKPLKVQNPTSFRIASENRAQALERQRAVAAPFNEKAWQALERVRALYLKFEAFIQESQVQVDGLMLGHDPMDHSPQEAQRQLQRDKLREKIAATKAAQVFLLSEIPLGSYEVVAKVLRKEILNPKSNARTFKQSYEKSVRKLQVFVDRSNHAYSAMLQPDGLYQIGRPNKIALVLSGITKHLLDEATLKGQDYTGLACRLKANYDDGYQTTKVVEMAALIAASAATYGTASLPLRAMINAGVNIGTAIQVTYSVRQNCLLPDMAFMSDPRTCDPQNMAQGRMHEASQLRCIGVTLFGAVSGMADFAKLIGQLKPILN